MHKARPASPTREGFAADTGWALHAAKLKAGKDPMDWKPLICWQVPLRHTIDDQHRTHTVRRLSTAPTG